MIRPHDLGTTSSVPLSVKNVFVTVSMFSRGQTVHKHYSAQLDCDYKAVVTRVPHSVAQANA